MGRVWLHHRKIEVIGGKSFYEGTRNARDWYLFHITIAGSLQEPAVVFLYPLCLLSDEQKLVTILVRQKQFGTY